MFRRVAPAVPNRACGPRILNTAPAGGHAARRANERQGHQSSSRRSRTSTIGLGGEMSTESEARYRGLLEAAPDAMVMVNGTGEMVLLNLQAEKQFSYHRDELVGQPVTTTIPEGFA